MLKGGLNSGQVAPRGVHITTGVYGKAVKLVYGLCQVNPDLIWYNDWETSSSPSNGRLFAVTGGSSKKKSGKKGSTKYYSAAVDLLIGHSPIAGVLSCWYNNQRLGVIIGSASGFIDGDGNFSFTALAGESLVVVTDTVPSSGPYVITVPDFVSDGQTDQNSTGVYDNTLGKWLVSADPTLPPGPNQYTVDEDGNYTFNAVQAGHSVNIHYRKTGTGAVGILAGIVAVTVNETIPTQTFNDYGGPGTVTMAGHWDRPLWNSIFPTPGNIDSGSYHARDPYTFSWDGTSSKITTPVDLAGYPVTVYYGVPVILKSDGTFYSSKLTPLELLNLEFETACGLGSEYVRHPDQQVVNTWAAGSGSTKFDLGMANAMPNLLLETLGAFTCWPTGDCHVADVVTDIITSGPILGLNQPGL